VPRHSGDFCKVEARLNQHGHALMPAVVQPDINQGLVLRKLGSACPCCNPFLFVLRSRLGGGTPESL
jgi:hypothetical protein